MAEPPWAIPLLGVAMVLAGWTANKLRLPPALGYLVIGVAVTPWIGSRLDLPLEMLTDASHWAVLVLLFFIGLELDLRRVQEIVGKTVGTTVLNIVIPLSAIAALAVALGWPLPEALALGIAMSVSSTLFGERLSSLPGFGNEPRKRMLGILLGEDIAAAALLGLLVVLGGSSAGWLGPVQDVGILLVFLVLATAAALLVVPWVLDAVARTHTHELLVLSTIVIVVLFGVLGMWAGSAELGAFVAGIAAAEAGSRFVVRNSMTGVRDLALVVFFLASGLVIDPLQAWQALGLAAALAVVFIVAKLAVNLPGSLAAGLPLPDAMRVALGLATLGEFSLILVAAAEAENVAHEQLRTAVLGTMLILLVATPPLLRNVPVFVRWTGLLPPRVVRAFGLFMRSWRPSRPDAGRPSRVRRHARSLASNLLLLVAWIATVLAVGPIAVERGAQFPVAMPILVVGLGTAVAFPLLWGTYRSYRRLVLTFLGAPRGNDHVIRLRTRVLDVVVAATVLVVVLPMALLLPGARWPVVVGGLFIAVIAVTLLWRQMTGIQRTIQESITRVLGEHTEAGRLLDAMMADYSLGVRFVGVAMPPESPLANRRLGEARIHELTGAFVAVLQRRGREVVSPGPNEILLPGDTLVLMGDEQQISGAEALVVAHGEALRLSAQSKAAQLSETTVSDASVLIGPPLGELDIRGRTGALVVGVWPKDAPHPVSYRPSLFLQPGDRLVVLGTALQVQRARMLAEGEGKEETLDEGQ